MKILAVFMLCFALPVCAGCFGGNASASNNSARANLNLGSSF